MSEEAENRSGGFPAADENAERTTGRLESRPSIIDLTLTLRDGLRGVAFEQARTVERDGWNARTLHLYSHAGTHMDAQTHFAAAQARSMASRWNVAGLGVGRNLTVIADKTLLTVPALAVRCPIRARRIVAARTGWSRQVNDPQHYRGTSRASTMTGYGARKSA